jgi:hypothetical protein
MEVRVSDVVGRLALARAAPGTAVVDRQERLVEREARHEIAPAQLFGRRLEPLPFEGKEGGGLALHPDLYLTGAADAGLVRQLREHSPALAGGATSFGVDDQAADETPPFGIERRRHLGLVRMPRVVLRPVSHSGPRARRPRSPSQPAAVS